MITVRTDAGALVAPAGWSIWSYRGGVEEPIFILIPPGAETFRVVVRGIGGYTAEHDEPMAFLRRNASNADWPVNTKEVLLRGQSPAAEGCIAATSAADVRAACAVVHGSVVVYAHIFGVSSLRFAELGGLRFLSDIASSAGGSMCQSRRSHEVRARELENLRLVARLRGGQLGDPDVQTGVLAHEMCHAYKSRQWREFVLATHVWNLVVEGHQINEGVASELADMVIASAMPVKGFGEGRSGFGSSKYKRSDAPSGYGGYTAPVKAMGQAFIHHVDGGVVPGERTGGAFFGGRISIDIDEIDPRRSRVRVPSVVTTIAAIREFARAEEHKYVREFGE